jgi:hypothetical protein
MRIEFQNLEQRPGTHTVPVQMTREELEETAQKMSDFTTQIEAKESNLREYQKEMREEIKELEEQRSAANRTYRFRREPKSVEGLWGFDFEDHGVVRCKTCIERTEKGDNSEYATTSAAGVESDADLLKMHESADHPMLAAWQRPLGTKWFVTPDTGDVFGPVAVTEADLQKELPAPATTEIAPFAIAFDAQTAIPLLNEAEVSAAQQKLKASEKVTEEAPASDDGCPQCGLPLADHPVIGDDGPTDPCKEAMKLNAQRLQDDQEERTNEKFRGDVVLMPDQTYDCGVCKTPTFGKDLQQVNTPEGMKFVCFACEQNVQKAAPAPAPEKKKRSRKKKGEADASAQ